MTNLNGSTPDIAEQNIENLKSLFPEAICEGKVDFEKLRQLLGDYVDDNKERYNFTWNGKGKALRLSQTPSMGTLRPCKEESKNFDTTQNLYIEGDNLEVLKLLQKSYHSKVKMIYIDPPYNTGGDFVYPDDFSDSIENYKNITGQVDGGGNRISTNTETSGRYHTDWLNMMYPRLRLARNLLTDDGVIFISIDDNEVDNLKKICNEIFGEENFRNSILTRRRIKSLNSQFADSGLKSLNVGFEYVLVYAKSEDFTMKAIRMKKVNAPDKGRWDVFWSTADRPTMRYDILGFTPSTGQWRNSKERAAIAVANYQKYTNEFAQKMSLEEYWQLTGIDDFIRRIPDGVGKNGGVQHWIAPSDTALRTSNWTDIEVSQIHKEFDIIFDNPKNIDLLIEMPKLIGEKNDCIILDFFSGSATTAHAVMQLNAEDGGNRKFICVQLPEPTDEKSEAFKAGYKNICEIGKERIRRAGEKVKAELESKQNGQVTLDGEQKHTNPDSLDIGFKVFKLDSSNLKKWQPDYDNLEQSLLDSIGNYVDGRTELDVAYEIIIKMGLDLTYPLEEKLIDGKKVYTVGFGALMMCLDDNITTEVAHGMVELYKQEQPETWKVVFKDNGFQGDSVKTNVKEIFKLAGLEEDAFTTV